MIVRILNKKENTDKFYDCRNTCILKNVLPKEDNGDSIEEFSLIVEFTSGQDIEVILGPGDEIFYMNDVGKTVHIDRRMYNR